MNTEVILSESDESNDNEQAVISLNRGIHLHI